MYRYYLKYINFDKSDTPRMRRQEEHSVAYSIIKALLKVFFGIVDPTIFYNENGKPYIKKEGVYFSISHSDGLVACAVADSAIGIDCERIKERSIEDIEAFAERFFVDSELELLMNHNFDLKEFYKIWTGKEATIKKLGLNMSYIGKIDTTKENLLHFEKNGYIICINV
ncbi:MAG: 4'-phosphopantetheinyl transferase superfamily protein [Clostridia bacterium]|nr:4'-phosphopantetheinyl transferase superfamily protein [Clostridia bacterium]